MPLFPLPFSSVSASAHHFLLLALALAIMAASFSNLHHKNSNSGYVSSSAAAGFDPAALQNTTFVQADPSNFRAVVQKLTGAPQDTLSAQQKATRLAGKTYTGEMGPRRPVFKLHERRQSARKLEIKLNDGFGGGLGSSFAVGSLESPSGCATAKQRGFVGFGGEMVMVSPVSPLELLARGSPRTPRSPSEAEEMKAIAQKGFYLHPSPLSTPRGSEPPELLPLFPLHSPRDDGSSTS